MNLMRHGKNRHPDHFSLFASKGNMFEDIAEQWVRELLGKDERERIDDAETKQLIEKYARKLEDFFHKEVLKQLEPFGKRSEYERMLLYDSQYINKYLNQTIPGYAGFLTEILERAKKIIIA